MALVKLMLAGSHVEAQLVKGLLETEGIPAVINGESRSTDMGTEAGFAEIQVLVNEEQLEQARLLLAATPERAPNLKPGTVPDGAVCAVHEQQATAICARCGNYLCSSCGPLGVPPLCDACTARAAPPTRTKTKVVAWLMLLFLLGVPLIGAALVRAFFR